MNNSVLKKAIAHLKHYGLHDFVYKTLETIYDRKNDNYNWEKYAASQSELERQKSYKFDYEPKISILVPAYETKIDFLVELLDSVVNQSYAGWELCLADASYTDVVEKTVIRYKKSLSDEQAKRIVYRRLKENCGISENTNKAYEMASGDYIALLDHDDIISADALYEMVSAINEMDFESRNMAMLYSDEDKITEDGNRHFYPHFKLDYNLEYLRTNNYICHLLVVSENLARAVGGWRKEFDGAQDYDFILRCSEKAEIITHVPKILYHWRVSSTSTAGDKYTKLYAYEAGRKAIEEHLKRCGESGSVTILKELGTYKVSYDMVLVNKERILYRNIVSDIDRYVDYKLVKSICDIDNCISVQKPFVLFVYESVELDKARKIATKLVRYMDRKNVAAVAPKEIHRGKVKQNGLCTDKDGKIVRQFEGLNKNYKGYFKRVSLPQNAEGIMFKCTLVRTEVMKIINIDGSNSMNEWKLGREIIQNGFELIQASDIILRD